MTPLMQEQVGCHHLAESTVPQVRADPRKVAELRSTFLKLSSAMEGTMVRWERREVVTAAAGQAGGGREQGAVPGVPVLLRHPGHLHQDRPPGKQAGGGGGEAVWSTGHTCHLYRSYLPPCSPCWSRLCSYRQGCKSCPPGTSLTHLWHDAWYLVGCICCPPGTSLSYLA